MGKEISLQRRSPKGWGIMAEKTELTPEQHKKQLTAFLLEGDIVQPAADDWKSTIGAFDDNPLYERISETGRKIRKSG